MPTCISAAVSRIINQIPVTAAIMAITGYTGGDDKHRNIFKLYLKLNKRRKKIYWKNKGNKTINFLKYMSSIVWKITQPRVSMLSYSCSDGSDRALREKKKLKNAIKYCFFFI